MDGAYERIVELWVLTLIYGGRPQRPDVPSGSQSAVMDARMQLPRALDPGPYLPPPHLPPERKRCPVQSEWVLVKSVIVSVIPAPPPLPPRAQLPHVPIALPPVQAMMQCAQNEMVPERVTQLP